MLDRPDLRAAEEAVRRWLSAVSLVRPASDGGTVVPLADPALAPVQAVVRHDPGGFASRGLHERAALHLPPAWRLAELTGQEPDVADLLARSTLPTGASVLGPVPVPAPRRGGGPDTRVRAWSSWTGRRGPPCPPRCMPGAAVRSARKDRTAVTVRIDPVVLG